MCRLVPHPLVSLIFIIEPKTFDTNESLEQITINMDNLSDSMGSRNIYMKSLTKSVSQIAKSTDELEATIVQKSQFSMAIQNIKKACHTTYQMISMESVPYSMDEAITGCKQTPADVGPLGELLEKLMASSEAAEKHYHMLQQNYQAASASCTTATDTCRQKAEHITWIIILFIGILGAGMGSVASSNLEASILAGIGDLDVGIIATWLGITLGIMAASVLGAMATVRELRPNNTSTVVVVLGIAAVVGVIVEKVGLGTPVIFMLLYQAMAGLYFALLIAIFMRYTRVVIALAALVLCLYITIHYCASLICNDKPLVDHKIHNTHLGVAVVVVGIEAVVKACVEVAIGVGIAVGIATVVASIMGYTRSQHDLSRLKPRAWVCFTAVVVLGAVVVVGVATGDFRQRIKAGTNMCVIKGSTTGAFVSCFFIPSYVWELVDELVIILVSIKEAQNVFKNATSKFDSLKQDLNALQDIATQICIDIQKTVKICQNLRTRSAIFDEDRVKKLAEILTELQDTRSQKASSDIHTLETIPDKKYKLN